MRKLSVLLALAVCVTAVMAQRETGIAGTVIDAQTLEPIVGARVKAGSGGCGGGCGGGMAYTNEEGEYRIGLKRAGSFVVAASAAGYETAVYPETVHVAQGQTVENIDFALEPNGGGELGFITGKVTDEATGRVVRGAIVKAETEGHSREVTQGCCGYRVALPAGWYWLSATAPGYEPGAYGDSVEVVAGRTTPNIDFTLGGGNPPEYGGIAGVVTDAETGDPLLGATVKVRGSCGGRDNTNEEGEYLIERLLPGVYLVFATMRGYEPALPETVEVVANQVTEDVDFALVPYSGEPRERGFVTGVVTDAETGDPVFPAHVMARGGCGQGGARTNEEGEYLLAVRPGAYLLRAAAREYLPAAYPETLLVVAGETLTGIDFELEPVPQLRAAIGGWVFDGFTQDELAGARIVAIGPERSYETTSDAWGEYLFDDVEPGDYRITVNRTGYEPTVYRRLVSLDPNQADGYSTPALYPLTGVEEAPAPVAAVRRLEVMPSVFSRTSTVRYNVPVSGRVSLMVTDLSGRVVATLQDGHLPAGRHEAAWHGTDAEGRRMANGVYFYRLEAPGLRALEKTILTGN